MTSSTTAVTDLRRAPLTAVRRLDLRAAGRDLWDDEEAVWQRLLERLAGLDDAAWRMPGAAPSDAGGPDWSLLDHVAHLVDWQAIAIGYVSKALGGLPWPSDDDFDGGDFDRFNERQRATWSELAPAAVRVRMHETRERLLALAQRLPPATIRSDAAWGWVYLVLHGHVLDHLGVIEPWTARLRPRQVEGDPFLPDPRPAGDGSPDGVARFWAAESAVFGQFDELVRPVPFQRWEELGPTNEWTLKDHVAHMARWFAEGADVIERHRQTGTWQAGLTDGLDAWNAREVEVARDMPPADALRRFDEGHARLRAAAASTAPHELASPEAGEWTYECLHGHVRAHLAMIGPWCVRRDWPPATPITSTASRAGAGSR